MNVTVTNRKWIWIAAIIAMAAFFTLGRCSKTCSETPKEIIIDIPAKEGEFPTVINPIPETPKEGEGGVIIVEGDTIYTQNPFNVDLAERYTKLENEAAKLRAYLTSIQIREYVVPNENDTILINNYFKVQGELKEFKQDYVIKPYSIPLEIKTKEPVFTMYGGVEFGANVKMEKPILKAELGFQFKDKTIYTAGMDLDKNFYVGANIKILNIKR